MNKLCSFSRYFLTFVVTRSVVTESYLSKIAGFGNNIFKTLQQLYRLLGTIWTSVAPCVSAWIQTLSSCSHTAVGVYTNNAENNPLGVTSKKNHCLVIYEFSDPKFEKVLSQVELDILAAVNAQVMLVAPVGPDSGGRSSEVQQIVTSPTYVLCLHHTFSSVFGWWKWLRAFQTSTVRNHFHHPKTDENV